MHYVDDISVLGDWIYCYMRVSKNEHGLYKMRTDGTDVSLLAEGGITSINVVGDWIYYAPASGYQIYRIRNDGEGKKIVNKTIRTIPFVVDGDWIYYPNKAPKQNGGGLYKVGLTAQNG
ncbi:MAG: DUF5050 domain-containing protein [Oscillospiraceae bacterium]|nr:DUF5050 domain-containing protein [Oscillospiraceae bacterium]